MDKQDVVIVGAGLAGLLAANRLMQAGVRAIVLEKGSDDHYMCNTRLTGGALHICYREPRAPTEEIAAAIRKATVDTASDALVETMAAEAPHLLSVLQEEGIRFIRGGQEEYKKWLFAPPRPQKPGLHWRGMSGDVLLRTLEANLAKRGGAIRRGARALGLARRNGALAVDVEHDGRREELTARAVIIADGGFQADPDLLREYITRKPEAVFQRNAATGCGDGLRMARSLGAAVVGLDRFYGHVLAAEAFSNGRLWPFPWADPLAAHGIVVDAQGRRFVDEGMGGIFISNAIARLDDPLSAIAVFDDTVWNDAAREGAIPPNPNLALAGATIHEAATLRELAGKIGVPADALERSAAEPNSAGAGRQMRPPFRALRLAAGITYTMGGILIDGNANVLGEDREPLPGLYAAGSATGGLEGGPAGGYVGGLAKAGITALRAAGHIAATLSR